MEFSNYSQMTNSVDSHIAFLRTVNDVAGGLKPGQTLLTELNKMSVGGKPFSAARHLTTLEDQSDAWDLVTNQLEDRAAAPDSKKVEVIRLTKSIMEKDPSYDLAFHTTGYQAMVNDLASRNVPLEPKPAPAVSPNFLQMLSEPPKQSSSARLRLA